MTLPSHLIPSWIKRRKIWIALECRCEICGEEFHQDHTLLHYIPGSDVFSQKEEKLVEESILMLCLACHREIHARKISVVEQLKIVNSRSPDIREQIRRILSYHPKAYTPPDIDIEQQYEEAKQVTQLIFGV
ncbi:MAG: HNH endonuclease [Methanomicrobiales archaeon]|nr:HNH endonuclease [Methanomicrobiales archaeon]